MADDNLERITILLQARDKDFHRAMDRNNKLIAKFSKDAEKSTSKATQGINKALDGAAGKMGSFAKTFAVGLVGGAVGTAFAMLSNNIGQTVKGIASIGDEAKRSGLGLEAFQQWKFVAEQNRIGVDQLVDGFKELSLRSDEFIQTGAGPALESFKRLGLSSKDVARALEDPSEMMLEVMRRMEGMDKAAQIRIADELFGGSAGERFVELLSQGEVGLRRTIDRAREVGAVLDSEMIDKAQEIDRKFSELSTRLSGWFKMLAVEVADVPFDMFETRLDEILGDENVGRSILGDKAFDELKALGALTEDQVSTTEQLRGLYSDVGEDVRRMGMELASAASMADMLGNDALWEVLAGASRDMLDLSDAFAEGAIDGATFADKLTDIQSNATAALSELDAIDQQGFAGVISNLSALGNSLLALIPKAAALRRNLPGAPVTGGRGDGMAEADVWRQIEAEKNAPTDLAPTESARPGANPFLGDVITVDNFDLPKGNKKGGGGSKKRDRFADDLSSYKEEIAGIVAEAEALNALALSVDEYGIAADVARKKAELLASAQEAGKKITPELSAEIDKLAQQYVNAAEKAELARERHDEFQDAVGEMKGTLKDAFTGLVTGANSFRDALSGVIGKLGEMALSQAFEGLWGGGGGSAVGSLLKSVFGSFSSGGYTGAGGVNDPAGIVHKGEVVWSQDNVRNAGGVAAVERMRTSGGISAPVASGGSGVNFTYAPTIDARGADAGAVARIEQVLESERAQFDAKVVQAVHKGKVGRRL